MARRGRTTRRGPDGRAVDPEDRLAGLTLHVEGARFPWTEEGLKAWAAVAAPPSAFEILDKLEASARTVLEAADKRTLEQLHSPAWIATRILDSAAACRQDLERLEAMGEGIGDAAAQAAAAMHRATWYANLALLKGALEPDVLSGRRVKTAGSKGGKATAARASPAALDFKKKAILEGKRRIGAGEKKAAVARALYQSGGPRRETIRGWFKHL